MWQELEQLEDELKGLRQNGGEESDGGQASPGRLQ
jgi:hypothetical protein